MNELLSRRELLKLAGMGIVSAAFSGACASKMPTVSAGKAPLRPYRNFELVKVSPGRVIREAVGLRPYRPSGFVVRHVRLGDKDIIHNYGHGGGGLSLSWGSSHLAVEKALHLGHRSCAVIGCGALGLSTARLMQFKGYDVTIYARDLPPYTTSNVAAGQWSPFTVFDRERITPEFYNEFLHASRLSYAYFRKLIGSRYGIRVMENFYFGDYPLKLPEIIYDLRDIYGDLVTLRPGQYPFDEPSCITFKTLFIDSPIYLNALMSDFHNDGGKIIVRNFSESGQLIKLDEPLIMNCTGLGSYFLFRDHELEPVKGQLLVLLPQPEIDYITMAKRTGIYMMPRSDGVMLGGSRQYGDWTLKPDPEVTSRIFLGQYRFWNARPVA